MTTCNPRSPRFGIFRCLPFFLNINAESPARTVGTSERTTEREFRLDSDGGDGSVTAYQVLWSLSVSSSESETTSTATFDRVLTSR